MEDRKPSLLARIITWTVIGVVAVVAVKLALRLLGFLFGIIGLVFGLAVFLLFTLGPILLLGWMGVKGWQAFTRPTAS